MKINQALFDSVVKLSSELAVHGAHSTELERKKYDLLCIIEHKNATCFTDYSCGRNFQLAADFDCEWNEVKEEASIAGITIPENVRFIAFVEGDGETFEANYYGGMVGSVQFDGVYAITVYGVDGSIIYEGDAEDCPAVIPPEVIGLKSYQWWKTAKT